MISAVKKSFDIAGDVAQMLDDYVQHNPGMSFTLIANQAIEKWLCESVHSIQFKNSHHAGRSVKKSANFKSDSVKKMDLLIAQNPGMNATLILNHALVQWLKKPTLVIVKPYTNSDVDQFLAEHSELMDELAK